MYIDRKEWNIDIINVEVELDNFPLTKRAIFKRAITFEGMVPDEEQLKRLRAIADACPIHKILTNDIEILTKFS